MGQNRPVLVEGGSTHTRRGHAAGPTRACRSTASRSSAYGPELLGLKLEEAERVVKPDDLGVLRVLFGREDASGALLSEILDAWSQVLAEATATWLSLGNALTPILQSRGAMTAVCSWPAPRAVTWKACRPRSCSAASGVQPRSCHTRPRAVRLLRAVGRPVREIRRFQITSDGCWQTNRHEVRGGIQVVFA